MKRTAPAHPLRAEVLSLLRELFLVEEDHPLDDEASLLENGFLDSTGVLELVAELETRFGFEISDPEITPENLDSLARLCSFVEARRGSER